MSEPTCGSMWGVTNSVSTDSNIAALTTERGPTPRSRRTVWALLTLLLVAAIAIAAFAALSIRNANRADEWQKRSEQQSASIAELQKILVARSSDLNFRIRQVNKLAASVKRSQSALRRSESDVSSLASRQRQLADEKARVEDRRAQLEVEADALAGVADAFVNCSQGQNDLLTAVLNEDYSYATSIVNGVVSDCQGAYSQLDSYQATYG